MDRLCLQKKRKELKEIRKVKERLEEKKEEIRSKEKEVENRLSELENTMDNLEKYVREKMEREAGYREGGNDWEEISNDTSIDRRNRSENVINGRRSVYSEWGSEVS